MQRLIFYEIVTKVAKLTQIEIFRPVKLMAIT